MNNAELNTARLEDIPAQRTGFIPGVSSPAVKVDAPPIVEIGATMRSAAREDLTKAPCKILLVDDDDDLRQVIGIGLEMMGHAVVACGDAQQAAAAFRSHGHIDLLLTDYQMPGRSGMELARELTALQSSLPVLMISGGFIPVDLMREMRERDWIFLAKPYSLPAFLASIQSLLARSSQQQAA